MEGRHELEIANNEFGLNLFQRLAKADANDNILLSPLGIAALLGMAEQGSSGTTQKEMRKALQYDRVGDEATVQRLYSELITDLMKGDPQLELLINHSAWYRTEGDIDRTWLDMVKAAFHGTTATLTSVDDINKWCSDHTGRRIDSIMKELPDNVSLLLLSAFYLHGKWTKGFDPHSTANVPFHTTRGAKTVKMMKHHRKFRYMEWSHVQAVELPLGSGNRFTSLVFLPPLNMDVNDFISRISPELWRKWTDAFSDREGTLFLPRILLTYGAHSLNKQLKDMGIKAAYSGGFDHIGPMHLTNVITKSVLELNEEGVESAEAQGIPMVRRYESDEESPFEMRVDRPFVLAIRDSQNGSILFLGRIDNPQ